MNPPNLEEKLGIVFNNKGLLERALTHRSYLNESLNKNLISNERLEFLGDAVLSLIVSQFLYREFGHLAEGDLTNLRASLVKTQTLAKVAEKLGLGKYLFLSRGEEEGGGRENLSLLADTFEALIGAIFIDKGLDVTCKFVSDNLFPFLSEIIKNRALRDYKSLLQEKIQAKEKVSPTYKVLRTTGPDHRRVFTIGVFLAGKNLGRGSGHSKQEAEQAAAKIALESLNERFSYLVDKSNR